MEYFNLSDHIGEFECNCEKIHKDKIEKLIKILKEGYKVKEDGSDFILISFTGLNELLGDKLNG